jgi:hypothetical protein
MRSDIVTMTEQTARSPELNGLAVRRAERAHVYNMNSTVNTCTRRLCRARKVYVVNRAMALLFSAMQFCPDQQLTIAYLIPLLQHPPCVVLATLFDLLNYLSLLIFLSDH